jgi:hypothetical protein
MTGIVGITRIKGLWHGVCNGLEDGQKLLALWAATPEMAVRHFEGWPPTGHRRVGHGEH